MKYIVCYSGGHSSALTAIETVREYGKENVILLNHNISSKVEHKDIKRFKQDIADYLDLPITYANMDNFEEMTPLKLCKELKGFQFQPGNAICTYNLKTKPFEKYLKENFPADFESINKDVKILYGFDLGEEHRIQRRIGILGTKGYLTDYPLALWDRTIAKTEDIGIKRPCTYKIFKHANCIGCLKAGRQHWYIVYCLYPEIFKEAIETENELGYSIIKNVFLEELTPRYKEMQHKGICPNDIENPNSFWKRVNETLPEQQSFLPCECSVL